MSELISISKNKDVVHYSQDFWEDFGSKLEKPDDFDKAVKDFADRNNYSEESLIAQLIAESFNESDERFFEPSTESWTLRLFPKKIVWGVKDLFRFLKKHLFDVAVIIFLLFIVGGVIWWIYNLYHVLQTPQVLVKAEQGIPSFYKIKAEDLEISRPVSEEKAQELKSRLVGKYSSQKISQGEFLSVNLLLSQEFSEKLANRIILTIPIKTDALNSTIQAKMKIDLLFANKGDTGNSVIVQDVILLKLETKPETTSLVIAVSLEQLEVIKGKLGNFEVFVVQK